MSARADSAFERRIGRIEGLVEALEASADVKTRDAARELTASLLELHRAGLSRILEILDGAGAVGRGAAEECARDELVASLLALHDLGPLPAPPGLVTLRVPRREREAPAIDRCEQCGAPLADDHAHLMDRSERRLLCACEACATLLGSMAEGRLRRVPRRVLALDGFRMTDAEWDELGVPVNLAFFFRSTTSGRVLSLYPSPAGAMESLLTLSAWEAIAEKNPILKEMEPDVEALFAHRLSEAREHFLLPIDRCFELVGLVRSHRRSIAARELTGAGDEIDRFLAQLRAEARPVG